MFPAHLPFKDLKFGLPQRQRRPGAQDCATNNWIGKSAKTLVEKGLLYIYTYCSVYIYTLYVCVYIYTLYVYIYTLYIYIYIHTVYIYIYMYASIYIYIYTVHIYIYTCVCIYVSVHRRFYLEKWPIPRCRQVFHARTER